MNGLTERIDDRLLSLHQHIADAVHSRTGVGCYALGAVCYAVVAVLVAILYAFWLWVGPNSGGSAGAILGALPAWVIFMSVASATLLCSVHARSLWLAQRWADASWQNGGLPLSPSPAFVRVGSRLFFAYIGVSKGLLLCFLGVIGAISSAQPAHVAVGAAILFLGANIMFCVPGMAYYERCRPRPPGRRDRSASTVMTRIGASMRGG